MCFLSNLDKTSERFKLYDVLLPHGYIDDMLTQEYFNNFSIKILCEFSSCL